MCYRLEDRKDKNSDIIYPSESDDSSDDDDDDDDEQDDEEEDDDDLTTTSDDDTTLESLTIPVMFEKIVEKEKVKSEMMSNDSYLYDQILNVIEELKQNHDALQIRDLTESENNGFQSVFDATVASKTVCAKTIVFLQCFMDMMEEKIAEVYDMPDLLVKFNFHGLRATDHEKCKENEMLIYCNVCCKYPTYPGVGNGTIKTGRIERKINYKKYNDGKYWCVTKQICTRHFTKDIEHWNNIRSRFSGHNSWD
eukprot:160701_1